MAPAPDDTVRAPHSPCRRTRSSVDSIPQDVTVSPCARWAETADAPMQISLLFEGLPEGALV
jgi:hypothetical protein